MNNLKYGLVCLFITLVVITAIFACVDAEILTRATAKMMIGIIGAINTLNLAYYIKYRL